MVCRFILLPLEWIAVAGVTSADIPFADSHWLKMIVCTSCDYQHSESISEANSHPGVQEWWYTLVQVLSERSHDMNSLFCRRR